MRGRREPRFHRPDERLAAQGSRAARPRRWGGRDVGAAVVLLADMVLVTQQMLAGLVAAARGSPAPLVVSRYGDVTAPPLLFRRALFGELLAWSGEGCGKTVVQGHRDEALFLDWPAEVLADVDTPEDFAAATARLNPR